MSKKKYPSPVEIIFNADFYHIKKGFKKVFDPASAADYMRRGVAWPSTKEEEAKLPETIAQIKERQDEEAAAATSKKKTKG